jgi:hypothetical protein
MGAKPTGLQIMETGTMVPWKWLPWQAVSVAAKVGVDHLVELSNSSQSSSILH